MFRCSAASELGLAAQTLPTARAGCRGVRHSPGTAAVPGRAITRPEMARWGGQGGWSRLGQMFKCLKILSLQTVFWGGSPIKGDLPFRSSSG